MAPFLRAGAQLEEGLGAQPSKCLGWGPEGRGGTGQGLHGWSKRKGTLCDPTHMRCLESSNS